MNPFGVSSVLVAVSSLGFGFFVYLKGRERKLNRLWFLFSLTVAAWGIGGTVVSLAKTPESALWAWRWTLAVGVGWIPVVFYRFVCELCQISRPTVLKTYYVIATANTAIYLGTDFYFKSARYVFGQFYWNVIGPLHPIFLAWWTFVVFHAHYELWRVFRKSGERTRAQLKSAFWAFILSYSFGLLEFLPNYHIDIYPWGNFAVAAYPAMMSYAVFRHQLFDIRIVIRKSLVYSLLVTLLTVGYFGFVYGVERFFQSSMGYTSRWLSLSAFALMALAFQPLKIGIQRLVDWLIFRVPQEELVKRMERLEEQALQAEKFKAVSTLAAGMAHEIKNPLTALRTFTEFIPERHKDPEFAKKLHEIFSSETRRIQAIVQELLDFAKPKPPQPRPVDVGRLIESTLDLLAGDLIKREIKYSVSCGHDGALAQADPDQMRQVFINLIQNAADAMPQGGSLEFHTRFVDGYLQIQVSDTGQGIPKHLLAKVFDPFVTTKPTGTGLGLAMVYSIIQQHRGSICAESTPGMGTTFILRLPACEG